jgi:hypothetical protein
MGDLKVWTAASVLRDLAGRLSEWPGGLVGDADCFVCKQPTIRGRHLGRHASTCALARMVMGRDLGEEGGGERHEAVIDAIDALTSDACVGQVSRG